MQSDCIEIWKDIRGYEGLYQISNMGRLKSLSRKTWIFRAKNNGKGSFRHLKEKILKVRIPPDKRYMGTSLCKNGKMKTREIHRLVLEAFVGPCPEGMEGCHEDGNRFNNRLDNLRWDTRSNNHKDKHKHGTDASGERNPQAKLDKDTVALARNLWKTGKYKQREIAELLGIGHHNISQILTYKRWR